MADLESLRREIDEIRSTLSQAYDPERDVRALRSEVSKVGSLLQEAARKEALEAAATRLEERMDALPGELDIKEVLAVYEEERAKRDGEIFDRIAAIQFDTTPITEAVSAALGALGARLDSLGDALAAVPGRIRIPEAPEAVAPDFQPLKEFIAERTASISTDSPKQWEFKVERLSGPDSPIQKVTARAVVH